MGDNPASADVMSKLRELVKEWRNRETSICALFPGDMAAERVEVCADELEALLPALEQQRTDAANEMLDRVRASIECYPNGGGDIVIMTALDQERERRCLKPSRASGSRSSTKGRL